MPNARRHYRLTLADALSAHRRALTFGGRAGVLNIGLVESAIGRPYSGYYRSLPAKAAALVQSMATNHGFADGNKRTTVILLDTLLTKSGYRLRPLHGDRSMDRAIEAMVLDVIGRRLGFDELVDWFKVRLVPSSRLVRTRAR